MAEQRPYSLLIRLGVILVPILTAILIWSYYDPPISMLSQKPAAVIPAPIPAKTASPFEPAPETADAVSGPAAAVTERAPARATAPVVTEPARAPATVPAMAQQPDRRIVGTIRSIATTSQMPPDTPAIPPSALFLSPTAPGPAAAAAASQSPVPGREPAQARDAGKPQPAAARGTTQKQDQEIDRKLSICRGC